MVKQKLICYRTKLLFYDKFIYFIYIIAKMRYTTIYSGLNGRILMFLQWIVAAFD